jgi:hypothetical protein
MYLFSQNEKFSSIISFEFFNPFFSIHPQIPNGRQTLMNFIDSIQIQSWWQVPSIGHFCSLFSSLFDLPDFDIEVNACVIFPGEFFH